ncbi:MAG: hypothetical protein PHS44_05390 [Candidatus Dojkabacteria bacterium]|nr:hypothetical protein [Candidatus Dojkabacteria bacterium]
MNSSKVTLPLLLVLLLAIGIGLTSLTASRQDTTDIRNKAKTTDALSFVVEELRNGEKIYFSMWKTPNIEAIYCILKREDGGFHDERIVTPEENAIFFYTSPLLEPSASRYWVDIWACGDSKCEGPITISPNASTKKYSVEDPYGKVNVGDRTFCEYDYVYIYPSETNRIWFLYEVKDKSGNVVYYEYHDTTALCMNSPDTIFAKKLIATANACSPDPWEPKIDTEYNIKLYSCHNYGSECSTLLDQKKYFIPEDFCYEPLPIDPCTKTCGEKEILTSDCECISVECTKDSHCSGFNHCNNSSHTCKCPANICSSPKIVNKACDSCICPTSCKKDQVQRADCSCQDTVKETEETQKELTLSIITPRNDKIFYEEEKIVFEAEAFYNTGDIFDSSILEWSSSKDGELKKGEKFTLTDLSVGTHKITVKASAENKTDTVKINIISRDAITIYDEQPENGSNIVASSVLISAKISSPESDIKADKLVLSLNGKDLSDDIETENNVVKYDATDKVITGLNTVKLTAVSEKGEQAEKEWSFEFSSDELIVDESSHDNDSQLIIILGIGGVAILGTLAALIVSSKKRKGPYEEASQSPVSGTPQQPPAIS